MRILYSGNPSPPIDRLARLLEVVGLDVELVDAGSNPLSKETCAELDTGGLVFDSASLSKIAGTSESVRDYVAAGAKKAVLLFASDAAEDTCRFIEEVTEGAVIGTRQFSGETVSFTNSPAPEASALAGTCFPRSPKPALKLLGNGVTASLQIDDEPVFGLVKNSASVLFVWSTLSVFDVSRRLSSELEFELAIDEYIPAIVFARTVAGPAVWHNPSPSACLIIDDPLLQPTYGHIDFRGLLDSARRHRYTVTLAFIPWNQWRTKQRNATFFRQYGDVFSVCVHGNDHTTAEFESGSYEELRIRAEQAIDRMDKHRARTGLDYTPVMVCPQERYSVEALRAIAASGRYLAVANTRLIPNVPEAAGQITGADLLQPAMDAWSPSSLLKRHYPAEGMGKLSLNLFLGRPLILAEHHGYFATGPDRIENTVRELRQRHPALTWRPLDQIVRTLHWRRQIGKDNWQVRIFGDDFLLQPVEGEPVSYYLDRRMPDASTVSAVSADGRNLEFTAEQNRIQFQIRASAPVPVRICRRVEQTVHAPSAMRLHNGKVALRRGLSELRDRMSVGRDRASILLRPGPESKARAATEDKKD